MVMTEAETALAILSGLGLSFLLTGLFVWWEYRKEKKRKANAEEK